MIKVRWVAITAILAASSTNLLGQDFARITDSYTDARQAVYASLSDASDDATAKISRPHPVYQTISDTSEVEADTTQLVTPDPILEVIGSDEPEPEPVKVSAAMAVAPPAAGNSTDPSRPSVIEQISMFAPIDSLVGCGLPGNANCGLPDVGTLVEPSCGVEACDTCTQPACGALCTRECPSCCGVGTHFTTVYADVLYLRARNAEVAYGVPADGPIVGAQPSPIQVGNLGVLDPDYEMGFRFGFNVALDTVSSLDVRYTLFESLTEDEISVAAPVVLRSLVTHPSTASAAQDGLSALASLEVDFDLIDFSYRHLLNCGELYSANYVIGARYAKLEQQFDSQFVKQGLETVTTDIDFDGGGLRLGLETARYSCRNRFHVYANGYASFMAGRFRAHYFQGQAFDPTVVDAEWEAGRIVPILDLEAGVGWTSSNGRLGFSAGYLVSAWFNTVTTQDFIHAIQENDYLGLSDTMTFDGLQARMTYRF